MLGLDRECWVSLLLGKISNMLGQRMCVVLGQSNVKCQMSNYRGSEGCDTLYERWQFIGPRTYAFHNNLGTYQNAGLTTIHTS